MPLNEHHRHIPQDVETPLTAIQIAPGTALYLYHRSIDSIEASTIGQDYLTFKYSHDNLTFAVCDGVGQSFMGDLAARLVGDHLVSWLWDIDRPKSSKRLEEDIKKSLNHLTQTGAKETNTFQLPPDLPLMLVQALELQRQYGSETMFVAGRLALRESEGWIVLCWLGDAAVAAVDINGELVNLGPQGHTSERWNATTGVKGNLHAWVGSADHVARVAGYTDGFEVAHAPTDAQLADLVQKWKDSPPSDDATLFDLRLAFSPRTIGADKPQTLDALTRPIPISEGQRTPILAVEPLEIEPEKSPLAEDWRPLKEGQPSQQDQASADTDSRGIAPRMQQIRVWQQAAMLGLTSAALAMLMLERLIAEEEGKEAGSDNV